MIIVFIGNFFLLNVVLAVIVEQFNKIDRENQEIKLKAIVETNVKKHEEAEIEKEANKQKGNKMMDLIRQLKKKKEEEDQILEEENEDDDELNNSKQVKGEGEQVEDERKPSNPLFIPLNTIKPEEDNNPQNIYESREETPKEGNSEYINSVSELSTSIQHKLPLRAQNNLLYMICYRISEHTLFTAVIFILILANTVTMAFDRYPIDDQELAIIETMNLIFYCAFLLEMIIKMLGYGLNGYFRDKFNIFDCFIVVVSSVELVIKLANFGSGIYIYIYIYIAVSTGGAITAFRAIRLLRIFKLARSWTSFQQLLITIGNTIKDISNFTILLLLFILIFALLGMELFAFNIKYNEEKDLVDTHHGVSPRNNFDSFVNSIITIFIVLIGEDWNNIMYMYYRIYPAASIIYFTLLMILGNIVMLNLFLAILLRNFEITEEIEVIPEDENFAKGSLYIYIYIIYQPHSNGSIQQNREIYEQNMLLLPNKEGDRTNSQNMHKSFRPREEVRGRG